nr:site-2 protease family protein [Paenibacillus turpanensis]
MAEEKKKNKRSLWIFTAIGLFLLSKGKTILALLKFSKFGGALISMFITIGAYALLFPVAFAVGLVIMIFIHEMGHVLAAKRKGLPVTAPVFIPFLGALIMMKRNPRDAVTEAYIAIGGPVLGTVGAVLSLVLGVLLDSPLLLVIAQVGIFLNLINLLPIHPLDGGRISTAVTRWLWLVGVIGGFIVIVMMELWIFLIFWGLFVIELFEKYVRRRGKGKPFVQYAKAEVPLEPLLEQGIMIPGEQHRRELPLVTYSNLDGTQWVEVHWELLGLHEKAALPRASLVKKISVTGVERQMGESPKLVVSLEIEAQAYEIDNYYEVPLKARIGFGIAYAGLAAFLIGMLSYIESLGIPKIY